MQGVNISRVALVGAGLAVLGVVLFVGLWAGLGSAGVSNAPRLFAAMCVPPLVIGVIVGGYALLRPASSRPDQPVGDDDGDA